MTVLEIICGEPSLRLSRLGSCDTISLDRCWYAYLYPLLHWLCYSLDPESMWTDPSKRICTRCATFMYKSAGTNPALNHCNHYFRFGPVSGNIFKFCHRRPGVFAQPQLPLRVTDLMES
jgi:hypothetical protein